MAGEQGFEPWYAGIKIQCLNQLGDSPTQLTACRHWRVFYCLNAAKPNFFTTYNIAAMGCLFSACAFRISTWQALLTAPRRLRLHLRLHKTRKHRSQSSWHRRERGATLSPRLPAGTNSLPLAVNRFFRTLSNQFDFRGGWKSPLL